MTDRILYDLAGAQSDRRFSPYCWRTRMALAHKQLAVRTVPWRFTEKDAIAFAGSTKVPVLVDGDTTIADSWAIALFLERSYPDTASLFETTAAMSVTHFINAWTDRIVIPAIARLIVLDVYHCLDEKDRDYFRTSREKAFGAPLENVVADRDIKVQRLRQLLAPLRTTLTQQPFLGGDTARYADYIVFGAFQWARCTSGFALLEASDPIAKWNDRLLDAFDGLARNAQI